MSASDSGSPPLSSNATLTVTVVDINDNAPQFNATAFSFTVSENLPPGSQVGFFEVTDRDTGPAAETSFIITGQGSGRFSVEVVSVTQMTNANLQSPVVTLARIVTTQSLDREDTGSYNLVMIVSDRTSMPLSASVPVTVAIRDVNDNAPLFPQPSYNFTISEGTSDLLIMNFTVS